MRPTLLDIVRAVGHDVRATLDGELGPQSLDDLVDEVYGLAGTLVERLRPPQKPARKLPVCRAGCDSCCRVHAVFVTPAEALRIASHLRATRSTSEIKRLRKRIETLCGRVAEMSVEDRARAAVPCPLLDEKTGNCTVHPVRPLLCRGYNSYDAAVCDRQCAKGDLSIVPPFDSVQARAYKHVFAGLVLGAGPRRVSGPLELIHAMRAALASADVEERWLSGEPVFDATETRIGREKAPEWYAFLEAEQL
jgi:Fe-S-cluster containining protein